MVLVSLGGEVEFAVGEVVISVASVKATYSIGRADSSVLFEAHGAESASFDSGATILKFEAIIALILQTIDVYREGVLSIGFVEGAVSKPVLAVF